MPRVNFIREQLLLYETKLKSNEEPTRPEEFVQAFRQWYAPNLGSFASSLSRFKSLLRKEHSNEVSEAFLEGLKPSQEEVKAVKATNRERLLAKCRTSVVLRNGREVILFLRKCLASQDLGELMMGLIGCTGLRQIEVVCRAEIGKPKVGHATDEIYWASITGLCKKRQAVTQAAYAHE